MGLGSSWNPPSAETGYLTGGLESSVPTADPVLVPSRAPGGSSLATPEAHNARLHTLRQRAGEDLRPDPPKELRGESDAQVSAKRRDGVQRLVMDPAEDSA